LESYRVNIQGLSNKIHLFEFPLGEPFFRKYDTGLVSEGSLSAQVTLDKHETFMEARFQISGSIKLVCDRSLDTFDYPLKTDQLIVFKFGHEDAEISEDVLMIQYNTESLELGQLMYEFIGLAVPMKKLHPRFKQDDDEEGIVFTSDPEPEKEETDPRWEKLKNLNKNK
jgi:uncharacterized protein